MDNITEIRIEEIKDYDNNEFYYYSTFFNIMTINIKCRLDLAHVTTVHALKFLPW